jgi:hypothetical protein
LVDHLSFWGGIYSSRSLPRKQGVIRVEAEVLLSLEGGLVVFLVLFSCFGRYLGWNEDLNDFLGFPRGGRVIVDGLDSCLRLDDEIDGR